MEKTILVILLFALNYTFSQNQFLDMIVTHSNDTIYGAFKRNKLIDLSSPPYKTKEKANKSISANGKVYHLTLLNSKDFFSDKNDSIVGIQEYSKRLFKKENYYYVRKLDKQERKDYIVTLKKDTIYGRVIKSFFGSKKLITYSNETYEINRNEVISFRKKGANFFYRKKLRVKSGDYIELLYDGKKAKLYLLEINTQKSYQYYYYIERNGKLELIIPERFTRMIMRIMPENKELINKLKKREYRFHDIYLVVKYFNES